MKSLILLLLMALCLPESFAQKTEPPVIYVNPPEGRDKKIDITVKVNGHPVRIHGNVTYNVLTGIFTFDGQITVTGFDENISFAVQYAGPMKKGPNRYKFERNALVESDALIVDWALSRLYLQSKDKIWFDAQ